jgi:hypothetical protein
LLYRISDMIDTVFNVGQIVVFNRGHDDSHINGAEFTVLRVMPIEGKQRSYRVRGPDGVERVLEGPQLQAKKLTPEAGKAWPTPAESASAVWSQGAKSSVRGRQKQ